MGVSSSKSDEREDKEFLDLHSLSFYHDEFIFLLDEKITSSDGDRDKTSNAKEEVNPDDDFENPAVKCQHDIIANLAKIFSGKMDRLVKVDDFPDLAIEKDATKSGFEIMREKRHAVLLRIFKVKKCITLRKQNLHFVK